MQNQTLRQEDNQQVCFEEAKELGCKGSVGNILRKGVSLSSVLAQLHKDASQILLLNFVLLFLYINTTSEKEKSLKS